LPLFGLSLPVPLKTRQGLGAAPLSPFGLIEPFGLWQWSRTALRDRLTGSDLSFFVSSAAAAALPPFGLIEPFGLWQGSRTAICFGQASEEKKGKKKLRNRATITIGRGLALLLSSPISAIGLMIFGHEERKARIIQFTGCPTLSCVTTVSA
jgi:hypothetical protein